MRSVTALSTAFLMIVSSMAGCIEALEEITEVLGARTKMPRISILTPHPA